MQYLLPSSQGCDSNVTLNLFVWQNIADQIDTTICENFLPLVWNGVEFWDSADTTIHLLGAHGEDSLLTMHVRVTGVSSTHVEDVVCEGSDYFGYGFVIPGNQTVNIPGDILSVENTFSNQFGCDSVVQLDLQIVDTQLYVLSLRDFCEEQSTILSVVSGMSNYVWSSGETASEIEVTKPGLYSVTATNDTCVATATYRVDVCKLDLRLPNAITPGHVDGHNDCFYIPEEVAEQIESLEITIYNRWGNAVFYSNDKHFKWFGDYNGKVCRDDVFVFIIKYKDINNVMHSRQGSITVL